MQWQNLVGVYPSRSDANRVRERLIEAGIPDSDIRLSHDGSAETGDTVVRDGGHEGGFWHWLFGTDVPEEDRSRYESSLREGRTAVSVRLGASAGQSDVEAILEEFNPIDIHEGATASTPGRDDAIEARSTMPSQDEERVALAKEELEIGKRTTERQYRIRVYPVERPVEEQVNLRDERVEIERRPASGQRPAGDADLAARDIDVIERHEEPVVAKKLRADEEVVIRKTVQDRTETVRDTVRETKVDVDDSGASNKPATSRRS